MDCHIVLIAPAYHMTLHGHEQVVMWECEAWTVGELERHSHTLWRMMFVFIRHVLQNSCCNFWGIWTYWVENQPLALAIFFGDVMWGYYMLCCFVLMSEWWNQLLLPVILYGGKYYPWQHILQEAVLPYQFVPLGCDFSSQYYLLPQVKNRCLRFLGP